jgi:excisionase family DNA binding protein
MINRQNLLSREEAARFLGVKVQTLALWASSGRYKLPFIKIGRLAKYDRPDLEAFMSGRRGTRAVFSLVSRHSRSG